MFPVFSWVRCSKSLECQETRFLLRAKPQWLWWCCQFWKRNSFVGLLHIATNILWICTGNAALWDNFGRAISDYNNQMITLSDLPFPFSETWIRKRDLIEKTKLIIRLIILAVILLSRRMIFPSQIPKESKKVWPSEFLLKINFITNVWPKSNVLNSSISVVVDKLLNLRFLQSRGRFVDWLKSNLKCFPNVFKGFNGKWGNSVTCKLNYWNIFNEFFHYSIQCVGPLADRLNRNFFLWTDFLYFCSKLMAF